MIKKKKSTLLKFDLANNLCIEHLKKCFIFYIKAKFVLNQSSHLLTSNNSIFLKFSLTKYAGYPKGLICIKNFNKHTWRSFRKIYEHCEIKYSKLSIQTLQM